MNRPPRIIRPPLEDPRTVQELESVGQGCCVARLRPEDVASVFGADADGKELPVAIVTWRGRKTMNLLIEKVAGRQMLENFPRVEGIPMPSTEKKSAPPHRDAQKRAEEKAAAARPASGETPCITQAEATTTTTAPGGEAPADHN